MATVVTAGCGISQLGFKQWPTWPKYVTLTHKVDHINVGGPASGNEHIARSITRAVLENSVDCVIVVWTNVGKLDLYVEDPARIEAIKSFPSRNFIINHQGKTIDGPGNWPSSVSDDNPIKVAYNQHIASDTYYYIRTLENILSVQMLCKQRNIPCYMFLGYNFDFDRIKAHDELFYLYNSIDWSMFVSLIGLEDDYEKSKWFDFSTTKKHGMIPVAGWHYEFYVKHITPLLDNHFVSRGGEKFNELAQYILDITKDRYSRGVS